MPINNLYHTWIMKIRQLQPAERITRIRNFAWLVVGIHQSRSVYLSRIAGKMPGKTKLLSFIQRLSRLLANPAINGFMPGMNPLPGAGWQVKLVIFNKYG